MSEKDRLILQLRRFRAAASREVPIEHMFLFGSRAWGIPHRYSDIDLVLVSRAFRRLGFRWRATKMYDFWTLHLPVDFLCYTPEEFNRLRRQRTIVREAVEHGIEIA
ncbi:MAG: nucleotidyltransferase domain-containing protein [Candidatus Aenigmarchaeota archaeon]|nr:nucleotidyltransferase domain-containing protein [Candidatus Aenigmarchaeota archaeon]